MVLFITFDFQSFGESSYLPNGKIWSADEDDLKSGSMEITSCYEYATYVDGELIKLVMNCDTSHQYVLSVITPRLACVASRSLRESGGSGSGGFISSSNGSSNSAASPLPIVDADDLAKNPKADCIYGKLLQGSVMNNFLKRYFGLTEPILSFLGELDVHWVIEDLSRYNTDESKILGNTFPINSPSNPTSHIKISIDVNQINNHSTSAIAYSMLHEAAHAKLIAEYYDKTRSTDFKTLFIEHNNLYGADAQHFEMYLNEYTSQLALGVTDFDERNSIFREQSFYQKAIFYQLSRQLKININKQGKAEYNQLFNNSPKNCE